MKCVSSLATLYSRVWKLVNCCKFVWSNFGLLFADCKSQVLKSNSSWNFFKDKTTWQQHLRIVWDFHKAELLLNFWNEMKFVISFLCLFVLSELLPRTNLGYSTDPSDKREISESWEPFKHHLQFLCLFLSIILDRLAFHSLSHKSPHHRRFLRHDNTQSKKNRISKEDVENRESRDGWGWVRKDNSVSSTQKKKL